MQGYILLWLAVARQAYLDLLENGRPGTAYDFLFQENEVFETVLEVCGLDPDYVRAILRDRLKKAWKQKPYRHINQDEEKAWWTNGEPVCGHRQGGGSISPQIGTNPKPRWSPFTELIPVFDYQCS